MSQTKFEFRRLGVPHLRALVLPEYWPTMDVDTSPMSPSGYVVALLSAVVEWTIPANTANAMAVDAEVTIARGRLIS